MRVCTFLSCCSLAVVMVLLSRSVQAFTSRALMGGSRQCAAAAGGSKQAGARALDSRKHVVRAPFLHQGLAHAAVTRLFSTTEAPAAAAAAPAEGAAAPELSRVEWLEDGQAARIAWAASASAGAAGGNGGASTSHKITYAREPGVVNQVTVGGASAEATLRGLVPGSSYEVQVFRVGGQGLEGALVARGTLSTPKAAEAPKGEVTELSRLEIRVGKIVEIGRHPDADTLYVEKIDVGEAEPRTIVSGLVKYQPEEAMQGRDVIVLCNLKPRAMRGITSHGMLLCASNEDHSEVIPLAPPAGAAVGELITFDGHAAAPESPGNRAGKAFDRVADELFVDDNGQATYKGTPFMTSQGPVTGGLKGKIS